MASVATVYAMPDSRQHCRNQHAIVTRVLGLAVLGLALIACSRTQAPLSHEAYVWQRSWNSHVQHSVAEAPRSLSALRVLALEVESDGRLVWPAISVEALRASSRPITLVVRKNGSRPIASLSLAGLWRRALQWRKAGVKVVGVEIDHDCATAALSDYSDWLEGIRSQTSLRLSITALPTWMNSPVSLRKLAQAVDEIVLQVHAVQAPRVFEPKKARQWLERFSEILKAREFRVALPTYRVGVAGAIRESDPMQVAALLRGLERDPVPGLTGVLWFRLPVARDTAAWSAKTLDSVIAGRRLGAEVSVSLRPAEKDLFDIVIVNRGSTDGEWPDLVVEGAKDTLDFVAGYSKDVGSYRAPVRVIRPGQERVVGWVRGRNTTVYVQ